MEKPRKRIKHILNVFYKEGEISNPAFHTLYPGVLRMLVFELAAVGTTGVSVTRKEV